MKKQKKYLIFTLLIIFILQIFINQSYAVTVTAETFQASLQGYADGTKTATYSKKNADGLTNTASLGILRTNEKYNVKVTDNQIEFKSSECEFYIEWEIKNEIFSFNSEGNITSSISDEEKLIQILKASILENCFVALTDLFSINSNDSFYFIGNNAKIFETYMGYMFSDMPIIKEELRKAKTVNNEVIKYYTTIKTDNPEEFKWITTL